MSDNNNNTIGSHLDNIQGNILGAFNKDYQEFLFLEFTAHTQEVREWLKKVVGQVTTTEEVLAFNSLFKAVKKRRGREGTVRATWMNIAFTHHGLKMLGVSEADLTSFPDEFKEGMAKRSNVTGDVNDSDPGNWIEPFATASSSIHAVLLIAADSEDDLNREIIYHTQLFYGVGNVLYQQPGRTRTDEPGHEHFGFKDGISQPGIRGVTPPNTAAPNQGQPGQDLLWPGEFVLGYPTQLRTSLTDPGPISTSGPSWTVDGSYLVFRRLRQDVKGFRDFIAENAASGLTAEVLGAKFVGRYKSGAPLEPTTSLPGIVTTKGDPSRMRPELLEEDHINDFEYHPRDDDGRIVPRASHIRKVYPRNELVPGAGFDPNTSEPDTQTHRLLRRGIPFGLSFRDDEPATSSEGADAAFPDDRGLLFIAYQASIANQFEFLQRFWINNPKFPGEQNNSNIIDGQDPVIAQKDAVRTFAIPGIPNGPSGKNISPLTLPKNWVITTGGDYFFQPSISALRQLVGA